MIYNWVSHTGVLTVLPAWSTILIEKGGAVFDMVYCVLKVCYVNYEVISGMCSAMVTGLPF
jgi:hypothetical protein